MQHRVQNNNIKCYTYDVIPQPSVGFPQPRTTYQPKYPLREPKFLVGGEPNFCTWLSWRRKNFIAFLRLPFPFPSSRMVWFLSFPLVIFYPSSVGPRVKDLDNFPVGIITRFGETVVFVTNSKQIVLSFYIQWMAVGRAHYLSHRESRTQRHKNED